jgi:predicted RND superfamily exporter protein
MAEAPVPSQHRESIWLRLARVIVRNRVLVAILLVLFTSFFAYPIVNTGLTALGMPLPGPMVRIDTEARAQWPDHRFIHSQDKFAGIFGGSSEVFIALVVKEGSIFNAESLAKLKRITNRLDGEGYNSHTDERDEMRYEIEEANPDIAPKEVIKLLDRAYPQYPVNHYNVQSLTHHTTRVVQIEADGDITSATLMPKLPETLEEAEEIASIVRQNPPFIYGRLISLDEQGALVRAGFVTDRLNNRETFRAVFDHIQQIKLDEEDDNHFVYVSGFPVLTGWVIKHAFEIGLFVMLTILLIFGLLWLYFRRWHGVLIPMVAAFATVIWGLGFTGWIGLTFDPLILVIPTIITARAISHTVQMAERFFEDYETMLPQIGDPDEAKVEVATVAMSELIVPGTLGIITDVAGLLMILVTSIPQMRELGIFGAFWVSSIIVTVEVLHPVLICFLPAPTEHEHFLPAFMVRFTRFIGYIDTHPRYKWVIATVTVTLFATSTYIALFHSQVGEARPGTPLFQPDHEFNIATAAIAERFGGVDTFVIYADGDKKDASGDALPILRMEEFERWMRQYTNVGATLSLAPILQSLWQQNHFGDPKWAFVPNDQATVRQQIFQLRQNSAPGFLRPYLTDDSRHSNVAFFYPDHKGETILKTVLAAEEFIKQNPIGEVIVRLDKDKARPDAGFFDYDSLADQLYYMLGPVLPSPRNHTLAVRVRNDDDEGYTSQEINFVGKGAELPDWIEEFREGALEDYENERDGLDEEEVFTWPETLDGWEADDVDAWWESEEHGIRAVALNVKDLIVHDTKAVDSVPRYQPTQSWTRGVQFVMAGGIMGILAAINDEVERSHVANIALILLVIFVLHSTTYQSIPSGFIILLQISTATMLSLAYMAIAGLGLNINTLPVQSVGVGIGVDYAIYIVDRIRQEVVDTEDIDEAVRRAVRTTGMAVSFTATTIVGGIVPWVLSNLRFQAEMALLLSILMVINMLGAITVVPAFYSILRPRVATALLTDEQRKALALQRQAERRKGLID